MNDDRRAPLVPPIGRTAWLALALNTLSCLGSGLTMPFLIIYLHDVRGLSLPTAGLVLSAIGVIGVITTPLSGPLIDRVGSLTTFTAGLLIGGIGIGLFAFATSVPAALGAAVVYGAASGLMWNGFLTLLTQLVPPGERSAVFALRYMTANVAFGTGALITGLVTFAETSGPYVVVLLTDAASYVLFAAALVVLRRRLTPPPSARETAAPESGGVQRRIGYRQVLADRALLAALILNSMLMVFAISQTNSGFGAWVTGGGGGTSRIVGFAFVLNIAVLLIIQLPMIRLARGRSRMRGAALAAVLFAVAWIVLALPTTLGLHGILRDVLQVASLGVFAVGEATLSPTLPALINDLAPSHLRGRYNAIFSLSNQIGPIVAPALVGLALGNGLGQSYLYSLAAVCLVVAGLALAARRVIPVGADIGDLSEQSATAVTEDTTNTVAGDVMPDAEESSSVQHATPEKG